MATAPAGYGLGKNTASMLAYLTGLFKPALSDPALAPIAPGQLAKQAGDYVGAAVNPQLAAMGAQTAARTAGGVGSIRQGTDAYASALAPIAGHVQDIGTRSAAETTAETGALADYLKGSGEKTFGDVAGKLEQAGIMAPVAPNLGAGSAAIAAATGLGAARDASTEGGNNAELAALLPGFARLTGQGAESTFRAGEAGQLADERRSLLAQVPGLTAGITQDLRSNETSKAGARADITGNRASVLNSFLGNVLSEQGANQRETRSEQGALKREKLSLKGLWARSVATANAKTAAAQASAAKPSAALSGHYGYVVDSTGEAIPGADGKRQILPGFQEGRSGQITKIQSSSPKTSAGKARRSAITKADSTIRSIINGALKANSKKTTAGGFDFATGRVNAPTKASRPEVGSAPYNEAVNRAVVSAAAILGPYMSEDEIVKFVQQRALVGGFAPAPKPSAPAPADLFMSPAAKALLGSPALAQAG